MMVANKATMMAVAMSGITGVLALGHGRVCVTCRLISVSVVVTIDSNCVVVICSMVALLVSGSSVVTIDDAAAIACQIKKCCDRLS